MAAPLSPTTGAPDAIKAKDYGASENRITPVETVQDGDMEPAKVPIMEKVDKFGAHAKTDPREIKLVKKLDRAGQVPSNMMLNRVRPSWYMASFCLAWSIVSLLSFLANTFGKMVAVRFILGIVEAPFYPGALYIISMFYTRKEIAMRLAILTTGNMFSGSFAGLIAAGIFSGLDKVRGLAGWQWLFIIQGALSAVTALMAFWLLPDHPLTTRWLTEEERQLAHSRIFTDTTDVQEGTSVWVGLRDAAADWRTYLGLVMEHGGLAREESSVSVTGRIGNLAHKFMAFLGLTLGADLPSHLRWNQETAILRPVASIQLHFDQFIILTTRTMLLYVLRNRNPFADHIEVEPRQISEATKSLANACIAAPRTFSRILTQLFVDNALARFGYFDARHLFFSTLILIISPIISPNSSDSDTVQTAFELLIAMGDSGNMAAGEYSSRLVQLQWTASQLFDRADLSTGPHCGDPQAHLAGTDRMGADPVPVMLDPQRINEYDWTKVLIPS
ncbi:hypothetical protein FPANT_8753 [Fusarium pseudoanthophilum]|uniref:Major facilitator superfamily (MFS) profile domain-containing protein n=1 Tax=Fusarium pseudoanthophilum TaxID=48495 RepID=A0A8H5L192_9HYPO|nr:hypothetical protein FPANT_8753 [Fusarium pseudoanthophilum]